MQWLPLFFFFKLFTFLNKSVNTAFSVILLYAPVSAKLSDTWTQSDQNADDTSWGGEGAADRRALLLQKTCSACRNRLGEEPQHVPRRQMQSSGPVGVPASMRKYFPGSME